MNKSSKSKMNNKMAQINKTTMTSMDRKETGRWTTILIILSDKEIESLMSTHTETRVTDFLAAFMLISLQDLKIMMRLQTNPSKLRSILSQLLQLVLKMLKIILILILIAHNKK